MEIIPAIDLIDGKVVRLSQGDYKKVTTYSDDPVQTALSFKSKGTKFLHVIDLDGAKAGYPVNIAALIRIIKMTGLDVEFGGGVRNIESIDIILDAGAKKVILGTAVHRDKTFAFEAIKKFGERVIFGVDVKDGAVKIDGWTKSADKGLSAYLKEFEALGLKNIIYTDISKDGMLAGPNLEGVKQILADTSLGVYAAGGVTNVSDIKRLKQLEPDGLKGAIIGKALYEGTISLEEALSAG